MTPCIETDTCKTFDGYGVKRLNGKNVYTHRLAYIQAHNLTFADIRGVLIRHKCDNRACINPDHLEPGTHADNSRDKHERGRANTMRGEQAGNVKLTESKVAEIRRLASQGVSQPKLAQQFAIDSSQICRIVNYKSWRHVA